MKVMVCSSYPPAWSELAAVTIATHKRYAQQWGYEYHADCSDTSYPNRSAEWGRGTEGYIPVRSYIKIDLLQHFLDPASCKREYDWVVWIDSDALITNYDIPITEWTNRVKPYSRNGDNRYWCGADIIMPFDFNGNNSTVIMARRTDAAFDYLWAVNNAGRTMFLKHDWAEMEAMLRFRLAPPYDGIVQTYSAKELCAIPPREYPVPARTRVPYEWSEGDWCLHLSALHIDRRVELARRYADELNLL